MCKQLLAMVHTVYDEVANFMATMNPKKVIAFKPSEANQTRFDILLDKQKKMNYLQKKKVK